MKKHYVSIGVRVIWVAVVSAVLLLSGCATQKQWQYQSEKESQVRPVIDRSVAIPPFTDERMSENKNMIGMYLVPIVPFGWQELNTPEGFQLHITSAAWMWKPNEDIAKATAEEISKSKLFREAFFTNRASDGDLALEGTIKSTKYNGKIFSYGLSAYGPMLWFIGLPAGNFNNELVLNFRLKEKGGSAVLWEKDYKQYYSNVAWLYHMPPDFEYSGMLKKILLSVINDMRSDSEAIQRKLRDKESSTLSDTGTR